MAIKHQRLILIIMESVMLLILRTSMLLAYSRDSQQC